jgi:poly-gamma-glutamate synthesis protein (capsule biosynthesis protein)
LATARCQVPKLDEDSRSSGRTNPTRAVTPPPAPGSAAPRPNAIDVGRILAAARTARQRGAQIVVLALHWGTEYQQTPNPQQLALAPRLARSRDIDLIISHHAHVVEPVERLGDTWVVYGLGNLLAWHVMPVPANAEGLLVRFTFTRQSPTRFRVTSAEYEPLLVRGDGGIRVLDVPVALASTCYGAATRRRLEEARARTARVVNSRGAAQAGLRPIH